MAENTKIEWANHTFNPWIGCTKVSPACDHCYAEADFATRRKVVQWGAGQPRKRTAPSTWAQPLRWNAKAESRGVRESVFCASLGDWADNSVPNQLRFDLADVILRTTSLDWLLLTKRIGNAAAMLDEMFPNGIPSNVWVGTTICNQAEADRDIPKLLAVPAAKRFLSMEPLLGPVDLETIYNTDFGEGQPYLHPLIGRVSDGHGDGCGAPSIDWIIVGGESGLNARPMHPDWARSLRDQCQAAGVPFFFKQWGEWAPDWDGAMTCTVCERTKAESACTSGKVDKCGACGSVNWDESDKPLDSMRRVGKKAAGRLLDGVEHNGFPT